MMVQSESMTDPMLLREMMAQLAQAFPDHGITLVLRGEEPSDFAVLTNDATPTQACLMFGAWLSSMERETLH